MVFPFVSCMGIMRVVAIKIIGVRLFLADINMEGLNAFADELRQTGADVHTVKMDVTDFASITAASETILKEAGRVDILVPIRIPLQILRKRIDDAKSQDELPFIQDEETHIWVKQFTQFYRQEIMQFYKKTLIFDEEKQVHKELDQEEFKIEGNTIKNYSFVDSSSNAMIQISDYVVSAFIKYPNSLRTWHFPE